MIMENHGRVPRPRPLRYLQVKYKFSDVTFADLSVESELNELVALARQGHRVTLMGATLGLPRSKETAGERLKLEPVYVRRSTSIIALLVFQMIVAFRLIRRIGQLDALITDCSTLTPILCLILFINRLVNHHPVLILRVTSNPVETGGTLRSMITIFHWMTSVKLAGVLFDRIYFISPMMGQHYSKLLHIPPNKIGTWPSTINMRLFDSEAKSLRASARSIRQKLALSRRFVVLHHGVLTKSRGVMETVKAFKLLKEKDVKTTLFLLGDGSAKAEIQEYVSTNDLDGYIRLHEPVPYRDVPIYVAICDLGIVPLPDNSWWRYQCPTKLLEYLAMNKPAIVTDIPGHRWILGSANFAQYINQVSATEISNAVMKAMSEHESLDPRTGRRISSAFSGERIAQMLEDDVLESLKTNK